ncbi:MAG: PKD domain-containing protein, partial [Bacteroidota bacterium]
LTGVDSIHWDFGDPAITTDVSAEEDPVYVYGQPGTYTVQLSVFSDEGCSESTSFPLEVVDTLPVNLIIDVNGQDVGPVLGALGTAADPLLICDPTATITPTPRAGVTFEYFDEQGDLLSSGASYIIPEAGEYIITVLATDERGCEVAFDVHVGYGPVVAMQSDTAQSCERLEITFSSAGTTGADSLYWEFDDPGNATSTSNELNPVYQYTAAGTYTVQLWAYSDEGCVDSIFNTISVSDTLPINLQVDAAGTLVGPVPQPGDIGTVTNPVLICDSSATLTPVPRSGVTFVYEDEAGNNLGSGPGYTFAVSGLSTITVIATDVDGCVVEMDVTVAGGPLQAMISDTIIGCLGGPIRMPVINNDPNDILVYEWLPSDLVSDSTSGSPIFIGPPGVYTLTVGLTSQYGCEDSLTVEVIAIDEEATLSFSSEVECDGQTVNFTNTSTATFGYFWTFGDGTTSTEVNPTHVYNEEGVYPVTLDLLYEQDCIESFTMDVVVDAIQLAADLDVELTDCQTGQAVISFFDNTLNNTGEELAYGWTFSMGAPASSNTANPSLVVTESGDIDVSLTVFSANGCQSSFDTTISVIIPIVELPDTLVICPGDTAFLNPDFNLELTYSWIGATDFNPSAINPGTVVAGTYVVAATTTAADLNCTTFDTVTVRDGVVPELMVVGPAGEIHANNNGLITISDPTDPEGELISIPALQSCGEPISLESSAQAGTVFDYTVYPGAWQIDTNPATFSLDPRDTLVVVVRATSVDDCLTYDTVALYSAELTVIPELVEVVSCAGLDTVLTVQVSGDTDGVSYSWTGPGINGPTDGPSISITTPQQGLIDYTVAVENAAGCVDTTTVQVNVTPFTPNMYEDSIAICFNETTVLPGEDIVDGYIYDWSPLDNLDLTDPNNPTVTLTEDAVYTVVITDPATGCSWTEVIEVTVFPEIGLSVTPSDTLLCLPGSVTLVSSTLVPINNLDIIWYADAELTEIMSSGPRMEFDASTTGTFVIYTVATDKTTNCSVSTSSTIIVDPVDDSLPADAISVCENDQSTQQLFPDGMNPDYLYTYEPAGLVDFNGNFIGTESVTLVVTTTDLNTGCFVVDTVDVTYTDFTPAELTADLELVVIPNMVELTVTGCAGCSYDWDTDNGTVSPDDEAVVIGSPEFEDEVTYFVELSANGCSEELFITLPTDDPACNQLTVYLPNAFSPNGDGQNDELRVRSRYIDQELLLDYELMIFNRWGQEMFRSFDPFQAWDGRFEGDECEPDVFGFYLRVVCPDGEELIQQGNITLLR